MNKIPSDLYIVEGPSSHACEHDWRFIADKESYGMYGCNTYECFQCRSVISCRDLDELERKRDGEQ